MSPAITAVAIAAVLTVAVALVMSKSLITGVREQLCHCKMCRASVALTVMVEATLAVVAVIALALVGVPRVARTAVLIGTT